MVIVAAALLAGYLVPELDRAASDDLPYVFPGGPSGARDMLGTIAGAMISVTGLVFSITMVVVQLASSQYSPRVLGDFLASRVTQLTLGVFAASFTYALTVLRSVRGESGDGGSFVPQLAVTLAFLLVLASVGMFLAFIHHITNSIQVSSIVSQLGNATVDVVDRYFPVPATGDARPRQDDGEPHEGMLAQCIQAREHGAVVELDHHRLVERATEHDVIIEVLLQVGAFAAEGQPALRIWRHATAAPLGEAHLDALRSLVVVEQDRILNQDPAFGVRKLVDIAERALSPAVNDPTTAVQVLDEVHRILRTTVTRQDLPALVSSAGSLRLIHRPQRVEQLVDLALAEPLHYGEGSLQVPRRVEVMLVDLRDVALPEHRPPIDRWLARARAIIARQGEHEGRASGPRTAS
ncbi:DUF2254 domain-containing protein [Agrococcus beijingensis]|uniref:DUF2254 domain-containing protein n=1 Tax=Agrococcus beijingensis TaxID=3068634 RepID=UPI003BEEB3C5